MLEFVRLNAGRQPLAEVNHRHAIADRNQVWQVAARDLFRGLYVRLTPLPPRPSIIAKVSASGQMNGPVSTVRREQPSEDIGYWCVRVRVRVHEFRPGLAPENLPEASDYLRERAAATCGGRGSKGMISPQGW